MLRGLQRRPAETTLPPHRRRETIQGPSAARFPYRRHARVEGHNRLATASLTRPTGFQNRLESVRPMGAGPRAKKDNSAASPCEWAHRFGQLFGCVDGEHMFVSVCPNGVRVGDMAKALDWLFAGRIHRSNDGCVGIVEAGTELLECIAKPRVPVRLYNRDNRP